MGVLTVAAQITIPPLRPARDSVNTEAPSLRHFDYIGAGLASVGCTLIIFGLTQGDSADWNPYTYSLIIVGFVMLGVFYFVEKCITRPLIPNRLWQTPGFGALLVSYFLGLDAYSKQYNQKAARVILLISFDPRRRLATVRHPILAALPGRLTADHGPLHPSQRPRWHPRRLRRLQNPAPRSNPRNFHRQYGRLRHGACVLPPADPRLELLGALPARDRARHLRARHGLRGRGDIHHQQRAEELPGRGGKPAGDSAEPHRGGHDEHQQRYRDQGRGAAGRRHRARWYEGHLVVRSGVRALRGADYGGAGSRTTGRGEGTRALIAHICLSNVFLL